MAANGANATAANCYRDGAQDRHAWSAAQGPELLAPYLEVKAMEGLLGRGRTRGREGRRSPRRDVLSSRTY